MFLIEEEERKNKKIASHNINDKNTENELNKETLTFKKKEYSLSDCVLSHSTMIMWGYPTIVPNTTSITTSTSNTTSTSTSFSFIPTSVSNTTTTSTSSLTNSISTSTLSTSFTTVSLHSASALGLGENKEPSSLPSSLPTSSSSSTVAVPKSMEKRIREEHSLDMIDRVIQKKIRKEDFLETSQECTQGTFLGSVNVNEKEIMKDHQKVKMTIEETSKIGNDNKNNDDNENSNSKTENNNNSNNNCQMNKLQLNCVNISDLDGHDDSNINSKKQNENDNENYHEDLGVKIVHKKENENDNENENFNEKEENIVEKIKEDRNNIEEISSLSDVSDVIEIMNVGSRVGYVPTITETKEIFNTKIIIKNEKKSDRNNKNDEKQCEKDTVNVTRTDGDVTPLPSILVFPYYTVSMQVTRQGPNTGPGVSAFRSTVSQSSDEFKLLWMPSSACTVSARTLFFSCHHTTLLFYDHFC